MVFLLDKHHHDNLKERRILSATVIVNSLSNQEEYRKIHEAQFLHNRWRISILLKVCYETKKQECPIRKHEMQIYSLDNQISQSSNRKVVYDKCKSSVCVCVFSFWREQLCGEQQCTRMEYHIVG